MTAAPRLLRPRRPAAAGPVRARTTLIVAGALAVAGLAAGCSGGGSGGPASTSTSAPIPASAQGTSPFTGSALVQEAGQVAAARCEDPTAKVVRQDEGTVSDGPLAGASMKWTLCLTADGGLVGQAGPMEVTAPSGGLTADAASATVTSSSECAAAERGSVEGCVQQVEATFDVTRGTGGWATGTPGTVRLTYVATTSNGFGGIVLGQKLRGEVTVG